ncbi:MAG: metal ABC transporter ATP-binding protein [Pseudomonadota bacterium]|jgi:zinc/manganese transport system ATP-binding protein
MSIHASAAGASIVLDNLTVAYEGHPAVHHLHGTFAAGSMTAVVGPNGAGKSSLLRAIVGMLRPAEGEVRLLGVHPGDIAYLPQQTEVDRQFPLPVGDLVAMGAWRRSGPLAAIGAELCDRVREAIHAVGLGGLDERPIGTLSVGQFQRVLFARVMVQDAPLILLDEPFNAIDERTCGDLIALVHRWHGEGRTLLAVLHDLQQVREHFPQSLLLSREKVAWGDTAGVLTPEHLSRARSLAEGWDAHPAVCEVRPH